MDLREPTVIGDHIDDAFDQLTWAGGYDHNWVLKGEAGCFRPIASVHCPRTGLTMTVESDQPAVQFYAGNYIPGLGGIFDVLDSFIYNGWIFTALLPFLIK